MIDNISYRNRIFRRLTLGEIGCYLSHQIVFSHIVEKGIARAFIFEDDWVFLRDPRIFFQLLSNADFGTSNFCLNLFSPHDPLRGKISVQRSALLDGIAINETSQPLICTMGYFVSRDYAFERLSRALPIVRSVDMFAYLKLRTRYFITEPDIIGFAPGVGSEIGPNKFRLASRLIPRGSGVRLWIDRCIDELTHLRLLNEFWDIEDVVKFLSTLTPYR